MYVGVHDARSSASTRRAILPMAFWTYVEISTVVPGQAVHTRPAHQGQLPPPPPPPPRADGQLAAAVGGTAGQRQRRQLSERQYTSKAVEQQVAPRCTQKRT